MGWRILLAKTGTGAIDIARTFDGDIDLAILDIVLPDMVGNQVYPLIMEPRPELKVIVCGGYIPWMVPDRKFWMRVLKTLLRNRFHSEPYLRN